MPSACVAAWSARSARHGLESDSWVSTIDRAGRARGGRLMRFQSTRDPSHAAGLGEAIARGLAPDGGLYVPERCRRWIVAALGRAARPAATWRRG